MLDFLLENQKDMLTCTFLKAERMYQLEFPSSSREEFAPTVLEQCHPDW